MKAMMCVEKYIAGCGLEKPLIELVKMRASQINGCAFCLDRHTRDARANGEDEQRLYLLDGLARGACLFGARARRAGMDGHADRNFPACPPQMTFITGCARSSARRS